MTTELPKLIDNKCSACGSADLILAEDYTYYTPLQVNAQGKLEGLATDTERSEGDEARRVFCSECGEYHEMPEELKC